MDGHSHVDATEIDYDLSALKRLIVKPVRDFGSKCNKGNSVEKIIMISFT